MRNLIFILIAVPCLCACNKEARRGGEISMRINGAEWKSEGVIAHDEGSRFSITGNQTKKIDKTKVPWAMIIFLKLEPTTDNQTLHFRDSLHNFDPERARTAVSFSIPQDDGDVACDLFYALESDSLNNFLQITEQENDWEIVRGVFQATLLRKRGCASSELPDTLRITEGKFSSYR